MSNVSYNLYNYIMANWNNTHSADEETEEERVDREEEEEEAKWTLEGVLEEFMTTMLPYVTSGATKVKTKGISLWEAYHPNEEDVAALPIEPESAFAKFDRLTSSPRPDDRHDYSNSFVIGSDRLKT